MQVLAGSRKGGTADFPSLPRIEPFESFTVTLRLKGKQPLPEKLGARLTHRQHALRHGARQEDVHAIQSFAKTYELKVQRWHIGKREVVLKGTAEALQKAFGVELRVKRVGNQTRRIRQGDIQLPKQLAQSVSSVTGLDNRPFARPHFRIAQRAQAAADAGSSREQAFTPPEMASLYRFPEGLDGAGQSIAIAELGGGFRLEELAKYFEGLGVRVPTVNVVSFPGCGGNNPGFNARDPFCRDAEVMLDLQVAGGAAPGAKLLVYFAPDDSDESFLAVFSAMVHDAVNKPAIVSLSWGVPEEMATQQFRDEFNQLLQTAAHLGITVCAATGDNAAPDFMADDPAWDKGAHVDFPASSPWALACGGTLVQAAGGAITREEIWFDGPNDGTGGGVSRYFEVPDYQTSVRMPSAVLPDGPAKRGVPDVSADAAPSSGYKILCDNQMFPDPANGVPAMGGTSAAAPLWAALVARLNQGLGQACGYLNPSLYEIARQPQQTVFRAITSGTNGAYTASEGWNACAGLGSVDGAKLLEALRKK